MGLRDHEAFWLIDGGLLAKQKRERDAKKGTAKRPWFAEHALTTEQVWVTDPPPFPIAIVEGTCRCGKWKSERPRAWSLIAEEFDKHVKEVS